VNASVTSAPAQRTLALLNYAYLLAVMLVVAAILTTAMTLQYAKGELPCPLCLLERLALLGVCFGIVLNFRSGFSPQNTGFTLLAALLLLVVSVRQTLLDIYSRPGHEYIGSAILGLHMPVWSIVIALAILLAYAIKLSVLGGDAHLREHGVAEFPRLRKAAFALAAYVTAICAVNLVSVFVQCGLGECHTFGYALLERRS
jgi:disulfide bond formation protein DsbB